MTVIRETSIVKIANSKKSSDFEFPKDISLVEAICHLIKHTGLSSNEARERILEAVETLD